MPAGKETVTSMPLTDVVLMFLTSIFRVDALAQRWVSAGTVDEIFSLD